MLARMMAVALNLVLFCALALLGNVASAPDVNREVERKTTLIDRPGFMDDVVVEEEVTKQMTTPGRFASAPNFNREVERKRTLIDRPGFKDDVVVDEEVIKQMTTPGHHLPTPGIPILPLRFPHTPVTDTPIAYVLVPVVQGVRPPPYQTYKSYSGYTPLYFH